MRILVIVPLSIVLLAFNFQSSPASEGFWCSTQTPVTTTIDAEDRLVKARVVFVAFQDDAADTTLPAWALDLEEDIPPFIRTMSGNVIAGTDTIPGQDMILEVSLRPGADSVFAWVAGDSAAHYSSNETQNSTQALNAEILNDVAKTLTPTGLDYWSDVDVVFMIHYRCTGYFDCGDSTDIAVSSLPQGPFFIFGFDNDSTSIVVQHMEYTQPQPGKESTEAILAHEFLHHIGPQHPPGKSVPVHYGRYDLMTGTQDGIGALDEGLVPVHPIELANPLTAWAPEPTVVTETTLDLVIPDFFGTPLRADREMFRVGLPDTAGTSQFFLLVNHQGSTDYDAKYLGSGLLIWHFLDTFLGVAQARDLELASGKFSSGLEDPVSGTDSLEDHTPQSPYLGSATDFFDGSPPDTNFTNLTNPNSNLYSGVSYFDPQSIATDFAIENIRKDPNSSDMIVDVYLSRAQLVETPNGGSVSRGDTVDIDWRVRPLLGAASVDLNIAENGNVSEPSYRLLASDLANTGTYSWHVLQKAGTTYRLQVVSRDSTGVILGTDESDGLITVEDNRTCVSP